MASRDIICFNPTLIENHKKSIGDLPKTDRIDAFVIADRLRMGRLPEGSAIGDVIAAGLIAEIAGISRFENDNALAKFSGIYWHPQQSGEFSSEDSNLRRRCNKYLRYYFVLAADQLRHYLPEYSEFYSRKFKESKTHHHKRALILTSRKAVRLVFALLRENKLYSPAR